MIPEDAIRQRSYLIWEREGCPEGKADEHWRRAKAELEAEFHELISAGWRRVSLPRLPISQPPQRVISARIRGTNAARQ
jgi:hypothetical protein